MLPPPPRSSSFWVWCEPFPPVWVWVLPWPPRPSWFWVWWEPFPPACVWELCPPPRVSAFWVWSTPSPPVLALGDVAAVATVGVLGLRPAPLGVLDLGDRALAAAPVVDALVLVGGQLAVVVPVVPVAAVLDRLLLGDPRVEVPVGIGDHVDGGVRVDRDGVAAVGLVVDDDVLVLVDHEVGVLVGAHRVDVVPVVAVLVTAVLHDDDEVAVDDEVAAGVLADHHRLVLLDEDAPVVMPALVAGLRRAAAAVPVTGHPSHRRRARCSRSSRPRSRRRPCPTEPVTWSGVRPTPLTCWSTDTWPPPGPVVVVLVPASCPVVPPPGSLPGAPGPASPPWCGPSGVSNAAGSAAAVPSDRPYTRPPA